MQANCDKLCLDVKPSNMNSEGETMEQKVITFFLTTLRIMKQSDHDLLELYGYAKLDSNKVDTRHHFRFSKIDDIDIISWSLNVDTTLARYS